MPFLDRYRAEGNLVYRDGRYYMRYFGLPDNDGHLTSENAIGNGNGKKITANNAAQAMAFYFMALE